MFFCYHALINDFLEERLEATPVLESRLKEAIKTAILAGGKRLRPHLVLHSGQLFGLKPEQTLPAAAAIELIHGYSLIHDDLPAMDDDDLRRGQPSLHRAYDEATAILAGDGLQALAFEWISEMTIFSADIRCSLINALTKAIGFKGMVGGQMLDMRAFDHQSLTDEEKNTYIHTMQAGKTGALLSLSVECGAILNEMDMTTRQAIRAYGEAIGLLFQITDDLLDYESTAAQIGKATQKDQTQGKLTFVNLLGIDGARTLAKQQTVLAHQALKPLQNNRNADTLSLFYDLPLQLQTRKQ